MQTGETGARLTGHPDAARRERLVRAAREVAFLESDVTEHRGRNRDVFRLAAMRRTRQRQLIVAPRQVIDRARCHQRHGQERLGPRSPERHDVGIARSANQRIARPDHRGVYPVARFDCPATGDNDVEVVRVHSPTI